MCAVLGVPCGRGQEPRVGVSHGRGTITSGKFRDEGYQKSLNYLNKFGLFWEILTKFQELYWERCVLTENRYFPRVEKVIGQPIAQLFAQADEIVSNDL